MDEFRRGLESPKFIPLEEVDPSLAGRVREALTNEFVARAGIAESRRPEVLMAVRIEVGDHLVRITLGELGTVTARWDESVEALESLAVDRAWAFSDTYKEDRGRYGVAAWG